MHNIVIDTFLKGGFMMWPILATWTVALVVVAERVLWWAQERSKHDAEKTEQVYGALQKGDVRLGSSLSRGSKDPVLQVIWHGLNHHNTSLQNSLQVAAGIEIEKSGRFLSVLDTIVTLAPLLGLLGTVTGIMNAFNFVGNDELQAVKVSGGIAEALIATASGLATAIFTLIPYNYFSNRVAKYTFELQTAVTNVEVLLQSSKEINHEASFAPTA
jgi:biopolymer transport protein ExbB